MKRVEMFKALNGILQHREGELDALQATINALRIAIREIETADDDMFGKTQKGTFRGEITDAMRDVLKDGPLHRKVILEKIQERDIHVGGGIRTVGAYLSVDHHFKNVGKGIWALAESPPDEMPSPNGHESFFKSEAEGLASTWPKPLGTVRS